LSRVEVGQLRPDEARARAAELAALLREAVDAGMALGQLAPVDTEQAFAEMIDALEPGERMLFGAFADDELVGTAQLERARPANSRHRAEVMRVVVRGDAQRQGVGRELMRALEAAAVAHGITLLWLTTHDGTPACAFYESLGYVRLGVMPDYSRRPGGELWPSAFYYRLLHGRH
jgi:ribosomal protein S18 acetylase RimI-like enzyme